VNPDELHKNICAFIREWKNPPALDAPGSLRMISHFASVAGCKLKVELVSNDSNDGETK
jgi:hypothetical protein